VGGGILIVPALVVLLGLPQRLAHGTSLAAIVPIATAGVLGFALEDSVDWPVAALLIAGAAGGALVGTRLLHVLPARVLTYCFLVVLVATAVRLVIDRSVATGRADIDLPMAAGLVLLGLLSGTLAGLLGVGGGIFMVPGLVILFGLPAAVAKGTSLAVIIPTAVVGTARNLAVRNADMRVAGLVGVAGIVSSYLASQLAVRLDEQVSNVLFAGLVVITAVRMAIIATRPTNESTQPSGES
jgi:uncharacterized membrane protein YfcA